MRSGLLSKAGYDARSSRETAENPGPRLNIDTLIIEADRALRTLFSSPASSRGSPASQENETALSPVEKSHAAALMRINHVGEVCAQALYQGQALTCRDATIQKNLQAAAEEETEHLAWTEDRIKELGGRKSALNLFWYAGSLCLGAFAGSLGEKHNLSFLAETERQVGAHLGRHLLMLPRQDIKSRSIVRQMKIDEIRHAETAVMLGAGELPIAIKGAMKVMAGVMTRLAYYI